MRYEARFATRAVGDSELEIRWIERANAVQAVQVPVDWTDARAEAWLDGFQAYVSAPAPDAILEGLPAAYADHLASAGLAQGLFDTPADARAFKDDLIPSLILGRSARAFYP